MKDLEKGNPGFRQAITDRTLGEFVLQEAARGNFWALHGDGAASMVCKAN
jgi:hypothetical protein